MDTLLVAQSICKRFGGVQALDDVSISVAEGEVHALMGENGAGKSTLGKILAGAIRADAGLIRVGGEPAAIENPLDAQRYGIAIIFQELDLFPHLSVAENMVIGNLNYRDPPLVSQARRGEFCRPFLRQVGLSVSPQETVGRLPIAQMQLVAIARALSINAKLIVMDESTSSLPESDVDNLFHLIERLRRSCVSVIYVSHKLDEVFRICDRVTVLRDGRYVATQKVAEVTPNDLIKQMVGRDVMPSHRESACGHAETIFSVERLCTATLTDLSFELRRGEVLGVAGLVGAGRSELGAAIFGIDPLTSGSMTLRDEFYCPRSPRDAIHRGVGLVPEDRKLQGLMMQMSVEENASISILSDRLSQRGMIRRADERQLTGQIHRDVALKAAAPSVPVSTLSGGNQQKVLLSRWLLADPDVIFLDDPTRGVDVGAKEEIYGIIERLTQRGKGVLLVSSELPELLRCCDRIMVLQEGRCRGILDAQAASQEQIMELATHVEEVAT